MDPPQGGPNWLLKGVHFTSSSEGWAVGHDLANQKGVLLHYSGGVWASVTPPSVTPNWNLEKVHFASAGEGWAVGFALEGGNERGSLLHYSGGTWTSVIPPSVSTKWYLSNIHFTSAAEGWAVGIDASSNHKGVILHYSRGGWDAFNLPFGNSDWWFNGVHFTSAGEGWAVGNDNASDRGLLFRHFAPPAVWKGDVSFSIKVTSPSEDGSGYIKFHSSTLTFAGTVELSIGDQGFVRNGEGCYVKLSGNDGSRICINQMASLSTDVPKNRTDLFLLIGTGEMTLHIQGAPMTGLINLDSNGTFRKGSQGETVSITYSGKIGGGSDGSFISVGTFKSTLTMPGL